MSNRFYTKNTLTSIGKGLTFPLVLENGKPPVISGPELIESSIRMIIQWKISERFFLGEFGSNLEGLLEEPNDTNLDNLLTHILPSAIKTWEPRVTISRIEFTREEAITYLHLEYTIANTTQAYQFVYPLYTINNY